MRYFYAKEEENAKNTAFRYYVAKGVQLCAAGLTGCDLPNFGDILRPKPVDTRTGDEIAVDVVARIGLIKSGETT